MEKNGTLVNILGTARSGSTMLDLMLGNTPQSFSCGEVYAWYMPHRSHHFEIICSCGSNPCPVWQKLKYFRKNKFHRKAVKALQVRCLIDSSKDLTWVADNNYWASKNKLKVVNIAIWKDPVDLAYSYWKRDEYNRWYSAFTKYYLRLIKLGIPFRTIKLTSLLGNPKNKIKKIDNMIGVEYIEGQEKFWEGNHHHLFGSKGTRLQIENRASKLQKKSNYSKKFQIQKNKIEKLKKQDKTLRYLIKTLEYLDIENKPSIKNVRNEWKCRIYPLWYYRHKTVFFIKKYFPERWPYEQ